MGTWRDVSRSVILKISSKNIQQLHTYLQKIKIFFWETSRQTEKHRTSAIIKKKKKSKKVNNSLQQIAYTTTKKSPEKINCKIFNKYPDEKKSKIHITKLEKKKKRRRRTEFKQKISKTTLEFPV